MSDPISDLRRRLATVDDLNVAVGLMFWDQQTMMPPRGGPARAEARATVLRTAHEMFISSETGELIEAAAATLDGADPDSDDARLVEVARRDWRKSRARPGRARRRARASRGRWLRPAWVAARRENRLRVLRAVPASAT